MNENPTRALALLGTLTPIVDAVRACFDADHPTADDELRRLYREIGSAAAWLGVDMSGGRPVSRDRTTLEQGYRPEGKTETTDEEASDILYELAKRDLDYTAPEQIADLQRRARAVMQAQALDFRAAALASHLGLPHPVAPPEPSPLAVLLRKVADLVEHEPRITGANVHGHGNVNLHSVEPNDDTARAFILGMDGAKVGDWYGDRSDRGPGLQQRNVEAVVDGVRWCAAEVGKPDDDGMQPVPLADPPLVATAAVALSDLDPKNFAPGTVDPDDYRVLPEGVELPDPPPGWSSNVYRASALDLAKPNPAGSRIVVELVPMTERPAGSVGTFDPTDYAAWFCAVEDRMGTKGWERNDDEIGTEVGNDNGRRWMSFFDSTDIPF